jgi:hypothetical protein
MKDSLHNPVTIDSFFKESLEKLPVEVAGCDLQWQLIRKQVRQGPPRFPGANALTICVFVVTTMLLVWGIANKKSNAPGAPEKQVPVHENKQEILPEKKVDKKTGASAIQYHQPVSADSTNDQLVPASPVFDLNMDSAKKIVIAIRPDSSKKMAVPERKDSLFIFW